MTCLKIRRLLNAITLIRRVCAECCRFFAFGAAGKKKVPASAPASSGSAATGASGRPESEPGQTDAESDR